MNVRRYSASKLSAVIILALHGPITAQTSIKQESKGGACSNIVALVGNVSLNCTDLSATEKRIIDSIPALLKKILASQLDPDAVMAKLDEIIGNQKRQDALIGAVASRSWKRLSDQDMAAAIAALSRFKGQKVTVVVPNQDADRIAVAEQLGRIFIGAQWSWEGIQTPMAWGDPRAAIPRGIRLHVGDVSEAARVLGAVLVHLYGRENVPDGWNDNNFAKDLIEVTISLKQ